MAAGYLGLSNAKTFLSTAASLAASVVLFRTVVNDLVPNEVREFVYAGVRKLFGNFVSSEFTVSLPETEGYFANEMYNAAETYLAGRTSHLTRRVRASARIDEDEIVVAVEPGEEIADVFQGVQFRWRFLITGGGRQSSSYNDGGDQAVEKRFFELTVPLKHKDLILDSYLAHILRLHNAKKEGEKAINLHMLRGGYWNGPYALDHPATFDTLAMDPELKQTLKEDLTNFINSKDYYRRTGKAWKRGYLLYGPPGTGKSSLVAAMANFLKFNVYDLELTEVTGNTILRELLVATEKRSILVIEDIDCSIDVCTRNREKESDQEKLPDDDGRVTLSGLLNFMDGMWSCCGEERIIVVTTNHKDRLDPALLRPGRMDLHIHMGYCSAPAFRTLASNYLGVNEHPLFEEVEALLREVEETPAAVAGELMKAPRADTALRILLSFLHEKKKEKEGSVQRAEEGAVTDGTDEINPDGAGASCDKEDAGEVVVNDEVHPNTSGPRKRQIPRIRTRRSLRPSRARRRESFSASS